jgi:hypothetical protein
MRFIELGAPAGQFIVRSSAQLLAQCPVQRTSVARSGKEGVAAANSQIDRFIGLFYTFGVSVIRPYWWRES